MPEESLRLLASQAHKSGATVVIRGLKDDSMTATLAATKRIIGEMAVDWQIDPPAFTRFGVTRAPTFTLSASTAGNSESTGCTTCSASNTFAAVSGDVSLAYALDYIARSRPAVAADAQRFLARLTTAETR